MDFISNPVTDLRKARQFSVIDDCNHEALALNVGFSYFARVAVETLETLKEEMGKP